MAMGYKQVIAVDLDFHQNIITQPRPCITFWLQPSSLGYNIYIHYTAVSTYVFHLHTDTRDACYSTYRNGYSKGACFIVAPRLILCSQYTHTVPHILPESSFRQPYTSPKPPRPMMRWIVKSSGLIISGCMISRYFHWQNRMYSGLK